MKIVDEPHNGSGAKIDPTMSKTQWWSQFWGKRIVDVTLAVIMLFLIWPVLITVAVLIKIDSSGPIMLSQGRLGFQNRPIRILKFRTMSMNQEAVEQAAQAVRNDPRITRVGSFLRKTSLDELPLLFSVLKGDMSLIGIRPLAIADASHFRGLEGAEMVDRWLTQRANFPPGLISPDKLITHSAHMPRTEEMIRAELEYMGSRSIRIEFRMLLMGIARAFRAEGAF